MKNPVRVDIEYTSGRKESRSIESGRWPEWQAALEECQQRGSVKNFTKVNPTQNGGCQQSRTAARKGGRA